MASVLLRNIAKRYDDNEVLRSVNLDIADGEFVVFVGPSGCGKSTLMRMIAGLEDISSGDLLIDGAKVNDVPSAKRGIAMVFQSYALYPHMTLYDNMAFGLKLAGAKKQEIDDAVRQAAKILHIDHLLERKPKQLSGGQRQRVAIGRAITRKPKVFLFDEPLSNLDAALRVKMRLEFARLHDELKTTMIYVTHDQVEAMTLADKIVVLSAGSVQQVGTPNELYHAPANQFVAGFIGSPKMNFLAGVVESASADGVLVRFESGETQRVAVDAAALHAGDVRVGDVRVGDVRVGDMRVGDMRVGERVTVGIRPEHLHVGVAGGDGVVARTMAVESLGDAAYLYAESPVAPDGLIARIPPLDTYRAGEMLRVGAQPEHCHLFDEAGRAFKRKPKHAMAA
ncbi:ABC transporter ATP-binding protein [Burkholderia oklahomensis]|uniref:ABC transporter ATP-binding protein n=1 Tax=Burkholderia oklahomensis TaxID=342113 RepID=UPI00016A971F|nr:sn-glycerol-3-phosphate ABC transporter ATP-binding protein UgpC [Burkholderia oklahomensis]AJX32685.1 ABC transporter family protein [Burkholderia oklahomensis C6786]AOI46931.1 maltose/maltodextrin transporter ATP-binding protein [Burkholderia oklahomensis C6786]KUY58414.1 maltose/maltodextrin transporter ATP-binding protein [Burkholderia oklahomensis C6786]MBI0360399.1 sn-glycerol-3-phosphate ABC transporter ATP-binding protein UgpC [Burkholderia oklahomensis]SUW59778.1 Maltose/maltodextr